MSKRADLEELINFLKKQKKPIWKKTAKYLSLPRRKRVEVNLSKIEKYAKPESTVLVPGKVLGMGKLTKKLTIAAFSFSKSAKKLIEESNSTILTIKDLVEKNPDGRSVLFLI